ncbi:MAG: hypothetical protein KY464_09170, partial [Gemmatimonadetes bacterium]|nr:hypothetical protein [Gemmatimonadota bacterium]
NSNLIGQWVLQQSAPGGDAQVRGSITCFNRSRHTADLSGLIERSDNPAFAVGGTVSWTVGDNGEGAYEPPDEATPMTLFVSGAGPICGSNQTRVPITHGNIQVRADGSGGGGQN